jgi:hypothetical protein
MNRFACVSLLALVVGTLGACAVDPADSDANASESAQTVAEGDVVVFEVSVRAQTTRKVESFSTSFARNIADRRTAAQEEPALRARALGTLPRACAIATAGAGKLVGSAVTKTSHFRHNPGEGPVLDVDTTAEQNCSAPREKMESQAASLLAMMKLTRSEMDAKGIAGTDLTTMPRQALLQMPEQAIPAIGAYLSSYVRKDGKLDVSIDEAQGVSNWAVNHVVFVAGILDTLDARDASSLATLRKLRAAVQGMQFAESRLDQIIERLSSSGNR